MFEAAGVAQYHMSTRADGHVDGIHITQHTHHIGGMFGDSYGLQL